LLVSHLNNLLLCHTHRFLFPDSRVLIEVHPFIAKKKKTDLISHL